jgi:amino acid adenylation domain-containing protein
MGGTGAERTGRVPELIHRATLDAAMAAPDRPVFAMPGTSLSYGDLADRAARLAYVLTAQGVRRGDRVGLYFQKSIESAIALYAVMQAGAAYVPLDPAAPTSRTRAVLQQCGARVLISHDAQAGKLPEVVCEGLETVIGPAKALGSHVTTVPWSEAMQADPAPACVAHASEMDLAYIIFTSGSTGAPKGIMHTHRSGLSYSRMAGALYGLTPDDRLASLSPLHFDMSTFDYLCGPQHGATTMIVPDPYTKLPASLSELVQDEALTIWYSVPFALTQMLLYGAMEAHDLSSLRWVLFGGEPFAPKHLAALTDQLPRARFSNVYGPAEINQCTHFHLPPRWREADGQPPIGTECANVDALILDEAGQPVDPGQTGELIVKSPAVMRGYWGRDDLNDKTLIRRPGAGGVADLWLRTGDLASRRADGLLCFHGRADRQVKVRGYRVELDEVEDALASHPAVEEAAAFPVRLSEALTVIEAAVTAQPGRALASEDLLRHASARLPAYAVPARLDVVESFPRTSSGKIDWKTLGSAAEDRSKERETANASGN